MRARAVFHKRLLLQCLKVCSECCREQTGKGVSRGSPCLTLIPTLSSSLADRSPKFAADLAVELRPNTGVAAYIPAKDQIKLLLQGPLSALSGNIRPIVFVIDALDECSNKHELAELLAGIARFNNLNNSANVKFILTSRPETYILDSPIADRLHNEILQLQTIDTEEVTEDIRLYIANTFSQYPLDVPWYTETDVTTLATLSNGLFVFASIMLSYVLDTDTVEDRTRRLQTALAAVVKSKVAMGPLDDIYESIIIRASNTAIFEPEELEATQRVLACILAARLPLSANMLAELLGMKFDHSTQFLRRLQVVVYIPEAPDKPGVRILHASFGDYLFDRAPHNVRIAKSLGHDILAHGCLKRMAWDDLCFNLSCSRSSFEANNPSSAGRIALSLVYACLQWAHHLAAASETSLLDEISEQIFMPKFLFWLEALSVLGIGGNPISSDHHNISL